MHDYESGDAPWYDQRESIRTVVIESGVTSVGDEAFDGCTNLTSVELPDTVTSIGAYAFQNTGFTTFTIPASVTSIGKGAFIECGSLTAISVEDGNSSYIVKDGVLFTKDEQTLVRFPAGNSGSFTIPSGVTSIGDYAFYNCTGLTSITIPSGVTSIGESAFYNCEKLSYITIPSSVTSIGETAFAYCTGLTSISIPSGVTFIGEGPFNLCDNLQGIWVDYSNQNYVSDNGILFTKDKSELICYPAKRWGTSYTVPDSVTSIATGAFQVCKSLTSVTIPDSVTFIGEAAFNGSGITSITIPSSVTSIEDGAFANCLGLLEILVDDNNPNYTSVDGVLFSKDMTELIAYPTPREGAYTIPDGVTSINKGAFLDCQKLTSIAIPASVTDIGENAFYYCKGLTSVSYAGTKTERNNITIESGNDELTSATWNYKITQSVNGINWTLDGGTLTISGSGNMDNYEISHGNGTAPWYDYEDDIHSVVIEDGITSIGNYAFFCCMGLTSVTIPDSVTFIGTGAFNCCLSLTAVTIPSSVTSIGDYAFCSTGLVSVTMPSSVTYIGKQAFDYCTSLLNVYYSGTLADQENIIIGNDNHYLDRATWHYES